MRWHGKTFCRFIAQQGEGGTARKEAQGDRWLEKGTGQFKNWIPIARANHTGVSTATRTCVRFLASCHRAQNFWHMRQIRKLSKASLRSLPPSLLRPNAIICCLFCPCCCFPQLWLNWVSVSHNCHTCPRSVGQRVLRAYPRQISPKTSQMLRNFSINSSKHRSGKSSNLTLNSNSVRTLLQSCLCASLHPRSCSFPLRGCPAATRKHNLIYGQCVNWKLSHGHFNFWVMRL